MAFLNPMLCLYAEVFGTDLLRYAVGAGGTYLMVNVWLARRLARHKIRLGDPPAGQIRREIWASLRTVIVFTTAGTAIALAERAGLITIYHDTADYGWVYFLFSAVLLVVLHDTWFYWTHWALHRPLLFRHVHRLHHRSVRPTPFTSYSFDTGEAAINAVYLPLVLLILPTHPLALFVFVTHMMVRNAIGHCGVELFPAKSDGRPLVSWLTTVTHHDLHHAHGRYNLGLYFTWWDRIMGTEHPRYLEIFSRVAPRTSHRQVRTILITSALLAALAVGRAEAFELNGAYASPGLGVIVHFDPCPNDRTTTCGQLMWVWDQDDAPHARPGDVILSNLVPKGTLWKGVLHDPKSGRTYRGTIQRRGRFELILKGCALLFCARQTWHSVDYLKQVLADSIE